MIYLDKVLYLILLYDILNPILSTRYSVCVQDYSIYNKVP